MTTPTTDVAGQLASDAAALDRIRLQARRGTPGAVREAAQQFEALLLNSMLKAMRDTTSQDTPFDSEQTRMMQSMLDQQLAQAMSVRGIGLADALVRQLAPAPAAPSPAAARDFVDRLWPYARETGRDTGIAPQFILAQAALESGWGAAEIRNADGTPSHNLFGVKAGPGWTGAVAETRTTEYANGEPAARVERFRSYASYAEAFADYAALLKGAPRYAAVLEQGRDAAGFARALQDAGYATDPMYAGKLERVIGSAALRTGLAA